MRWKKAAPSAPKWPSWPTTTCTTAAGTANTPPAAASGCWAPPALIYVYSIPDERDGMTQENYAAACCAVQNLLLAAVAEGLAGDWSTGNVVRHPGLAAALGAEPDWTMVGALFIGYPARPSASVRTPAPGVTVWS